MQKPRLNFWQIWNMSFGFLGIQFGWGLQMANMSPIYKYLGARDDQIPLLWLAAPGIDRSAAYRQFVTLYMDRAGSPILLAWWGLHALHVYAWLRGQCSGNPDVA